MNKEFYTNTNQQIKLIQGWPSIAGVERLSAAETFYIAKDFGTILLQEINTPEFLFRYFVFRLHKAVTLLIKENDEGLQSLLTLKGSWQLSGKGPLTYQCNGGQFLLLNAGTNTLEAAISSATDCHLLNVYYPSQTYSQLYPFFPSLKKDVNKHRKPFFFLPSPRAVRHSVLDAAHEVLFETYKPYLQNYYRSLKLRQALFTQLAQVYTEEHGRRSTIVEKEMAEKARAIIEEDLAVHHSNEDLAKAVGWSESTLKRAFRQEFGLAMYEYLRRVRMHKAKEMLLMGEQVKTTAFAIGMRPSNFTSEFQKYFGYKATSLRSVKK